MGEGGGPSPKEGERIFGGEEGNFLGVLKNTIPPLPPPPPPQKKDTPLKLNDTPPQEKNTSRGECFLFVGVEGYIVICLVSSRGAVAVQKVWTAYRPCLLH